MFKEGENLYVRLRLTRYSQKVVYIADLRLSE